MSSDDSLSTTSSRSSTKSNMRISMPPSQYGDRSPAYTMSPMPSPSQNPSTASSQAETHHDTHHHRVHIATPHPLAATANFLDKHVPVFNKHHNEFHTQHEIRAAKREARRSMVDTPIPEVDGEHVPSGSVGAALHAMTAAAAAPSLADSHHALDPDAWNQILAKREAARLRSGSEMSRPEAGLQYSSDSDSNPKSSPAITP